MSTVRSILIRGTIKGQGIVNYGGKESKFLNRKLYPDQASVFRNDNWKAAKVSITQEGTRENRDGKVFPNLIARIKISAACLRSAIFGEDQPHHNPGILHAPIVLVRFLASTAALLRGYMLESKGVTGLKRKSPIILTDAVQTNHSVPVFEPLTARVPKNSNSNDGKSPEEIETADGNTSLSFKQSVGEMEYEFSGVIDLNLLQFVSLSEMYDRLAVHPDYVEKYQDALTRTLGSKAPAKGWYMLSTATNGLPEEGMLLNQEQVVFLVKEFIKRLLSLHIARSNGWAKIEKVELKHVVDPIQDIRDGAAGWYTVQETKDVRLTPADVTVFFNAVSEQEAKELYGTMDTAKDQKSEAKKASDEAKKAKKAAKESQG